MIIVISLSKAICVVFKRVNLEMQLQDLLRDFYIVSLGIMAVSYKKQSRLQLL